MTAGAPIADSGPDDVPSSRRRAWRMSERSVAEPEAPRFRSCAPARHPHLPLCQDGGAGLWGQADCCDQPVVSVKNQQAMLSGSSARPISPSGASAIPSSRSFQNENIRDVLATIWSNGRRHLDRRGCPDQAGNLGDLTLLDRAIGSNRPPTPTRRVRRAAKSLPQTRSTCKPGARSHFNSPLGIAGVEFLGNVLVISCMAGSSFAI